MNRRKLLTTLATAAGLPVVWKPEVIAGLDPAFLHGGPPQCVPTFSACFGIIQKFVANGETLDEPPEASDETLELVWSKETTLPEYGALHQRLYATKGTYPQGFDPEKELSTFASISSERTTDGNVIWMDVKP
jgi:hypothetical protein